MSQNDASAALADEEDSIIDPAPRATSSSSTSSSSDPLPALPSSTTTTNTPTTATATATATATTSAVYAKTSKVDHLTQLLRQLDSLIFIQLGVAYYHDNLSFLLALRALSQVLYVQPKPTGFVVNGLAPSLVVNLLCILTHLLHDRPEAVSRYSRGWIHGGLLIDFVGELGPVSRASLLAYDCLIVLLQVLMLMVGHERRRVEGGGDGVGADWEKYSSSVAAPAGGGGAAGAAVAATEQDLDAEEAGFRRSLQGVEAGAADAAEEEEENQLGEDGIEMDRLLPSDRSRQRRRRRRRHGSSKATTAGGMSEDSDFIAVIHVKESLKQLARRPPALSPSTATDTGERAARARALLGRLLADRLAVAR